MTVEDVKDHGEETGDWVARATIDLVKTQMTTSAVEASELPGLIRNVGEAVGAVAGRTGTVPAGKASSAGRSRSVSAGRRRVRAGGGSPSDGDDGGAARAAEAPAAAEGAPTAGTPDEGAGDVSTDRGGSGENSAASKPEWMPEGTYGPQRPPDDPAVPIEQAVRSDAVVCLEDGREMKLLKPHLKRKFGMSIKQYRRKWGIDAESCPAVAPTYRHRRQQIAKRTGMGAHREVEHAPAEPAESVRAALPARSTPSAGAGSGAETGDDLTRIRGIGNHIREQLNAIGITTFDDLAKADPGRVADALKGTNFLMTRSRIERWQSEARRTAGADEPEAA